MAEGGLLESPGCALSHRTTLNHNDESKFWKQLFTSCYLFADAAPGYLFHHALFGVTLGGLLRLMLLMHVISSERQLAKLPWMWRTHRQPLTVP